MRPRPICRLLLRITLLFSAAPLAAAGPASDVQRITLRVSETAGIRRFGYPVSMVLRLSAPVPDVEHFRLLDRGKPVTAQFRPHGDTHEGIRAVSLDFNASPAPLEARDYVVEYGPTVPVAPQVKGGLTVETTEREFRVRHPSDLRFIVPRNLLGLLHQVRADGTDYVREGSAGLMIRYKDDIRFRAGGLGPYGTPTVGRVVKEGPLAVTLRFEGTEALRGGRSVASAVEMEFPISKSWVRVVWTVDDPNGFVAGLGADLNLHLEGEPTLIDFGAGSSVYTALRRDQEAVLRQNVRANHPHALAWETEVGPVGRLAPYVVATPSGPTRAEGWAHIMDRRRCTAVAVAGFATEHGAELVAGADGRLRLWRNFGHTGSPAPSGSKQLTFWLHFVSMPVQVGAATSPQAMLAPLHVEILKQR
jgi:hypothetical protein